MTIHLFDFNNNMFANEADNEIVAGSHCSEKVEYSENYETDSEVINLTPSPKRIGSFSPRERKLQGRLLTVMMKQAYDNLKSSHSTRKHCQTSKPKRKKVPSCLVKTPVFKRVGITTIQNNQTSAIERWEAAQVALAEANSQNVLLQRQLQDCRLELRTVQRQCKMQAARLNKAIGQEADLPQLVDRLSADIRALQTRLRDKCSQYDSSQRRISELQHRIYVLEKDRDEHQSQAMVDDGAQRRNVARLDEVLTELQAEKKKSAILAHQLEVSARSQKQQNLLANEQIKQLRRNCRDLENQLHERTQLLQEKIKLLELQNIYSLRIPKTVPSHLPPAENSRALTPEMHDRKDSASAPAMTRTMSQIKSRPAQSIQQKFCVKMGRSRIRPVDSGEMSTRTEPDMATAKSIRDTIHKSGTVFSLLVDSSTCESMVDPCTNSDVTGNGMNGQRTSGMSSSQSTSQTVNQLASVDLNRFHGDGSATLSTATRDELSNCTLSSEKCIPRKNEKSNLEEKSVRAEESHVPVTRMGEENELVSMIASQNQRPIDMTLATQDPSLSGSSQTTSALVSQEEEKHEMERKARLLRALKALDEQSNPTIEDATMRMDDREGDAVNRKTPIVTKLVNHGERPEDFTRLTKKRDQELWDELFGSEAPANPCKNTPNIYRGHAGLMAKSTRNDLSLVKEGAKSTTPLSTANQHGVELSHGHFQNNNFKSPANFSTSKSANKPIFSRVAENQIESSKTLKILDSCEDQEVDSEFEELHI